MPGKAKTLYMTAGKAAWRYLAQAIRERAMNIAKGSEITEQDRAIIASDLRTLANMVERYHDFPRKVS